MTYGQNMKLVVVLPQAFRNMLPVLLTQTIILFQDTSLVYAIGAYDMLKGFEIAGKNLWPPDRSLHGGGRGLFHHLLRPVVERQVACTRRSPSSADMQQQPPRRARAPFSSNEAAEGGTPPARRAGLRGGSLAASCTRAGIRDWSEK